MEEDKTHSTKISPKRRRNFSEDSLFNFIPEVNNLENDKYKRQVFNNFNLLNQASAPPRLNTVFEDAEINSDESINSIRHQKFIEINNGLRKEAFYFEAIPDEIVREVPVITAAANINFNHNLAKNTFTSHARHKNPIDLKKPLIVEVPNRMKDCLPVLAKLTSQDITSLEYIISTSRDIPFIQGEHMDLAIEKLDIFMMK